MPGTPRRRLIAPPVGRRVVLAVVAATLLMIALQDFRYRGHQWEGPFLTALAEAAVEGEAACLAQATRFSWGRVYLLPPVGEIGAHPAITGLSWSDGDLRALYDLRASGQGAAIMVFAQAHRVQWYGALPRHGLTPDGERVEIRLLGLPLGGLAPDEAAFSARIGLDEGGMHLSVLPVPGAGTCRNRATVW